MIFFMTLMLNSKIALSQPQTWYNDRSEINHLEYYLEFSPEQKGYSTTKYALDLEAIETEGDSILEVDVTYDDVDLTEAGGNFNYKITLDDHELFYPSIWFYIQYFRDTHTELFLDLTKIGEPQTFRVDETVIFANYFKIEVYHGVSKLDLIFNYAGEKEYNKDLTYNFTTYHYQANYTWVTDGIY
jgi:hypothetical protein